MTCKSKRWSCQIKKIAMGFLILLVIGSAGPWQGLSALAYPTTSIDLGGVVNYEKCEW